MEKGKKIKIDEEKIWKAWEPILNPKEFEKKDLPEPLNDFVLPVLKKAFDKLEKEEEMSKIDKKKKKLQSRIDFLKEELRVSLTKKTSSTKEISLPEYQKKIGDLQKKLNEL